MISNKFRVHPAATPTKRLARRRPMHPPLTATGSTRSPPSSPDRRRRTSPPAFRSRLPSTPSPFPSRSTRSPPATAAPSPNRYNLPSPVTSAVWLKPPAAATMLTPPPPLESPRPFSSLSPSLPAFDAAELNGWGGVGGGAGGAREMISRGTAHPPACARRARARDTSRSRESGTKVCCWCVSCLPMVGGHWCGVRDR